MNQDRFPGADAICRGFGGSSFWLKPLNGETYRKLMEAGVGIDPSGPDEAGTYPTVHFNAPTRTNTQNNPGLRRQYHAVMNALMGCVIRDPYPGPPGWPYAIGDPEAIWD